VETWLVSIARRKLIDAARRRRRRPEVLSADLSASDEEGAAERVWSSSAGPCDADPAAQVVRREGLQELRRAVRALPELQREALLLRCVDQLSIAETAKVLGRSENAVKALLHRARAALQGRLSQDEEPAETGWESGNVEKNAAPTCAAPPAC
jgi:RNA polymerase sigma-70 factor (ECF subfamily)